MEIYSYFGICVVLLILIILYYYIQKPRKRNINDVYAKYMLRTTDPDIAFTHRKLGKNHYENYYLNFEAGADKLLKRTFNTYPVTGLGEAYTPKEHGLLTENENGFRIDGVDAVFECPENWIWDTVQKTCTLVPVCGYDDIDKVKGLDYYHFQSDEIHARLRKNIERTMYSNVTTYHPRIYIHCKNYNDYELEKCPNNKLYNQKEIQDVSSDCCEYYDVCEDKREYEIHKDDIGEGELADNEYYMCINSKSTIKECPQGTIFNTDRKGCIEENRCAKMENGHTFYVDEISYVSCFNGLENTIRCNNGVYDGDGDANLSCTIDKSEQIIEYNTTEYMNIPISLYEYNNNQKVVKSVPLLTNKRNMKLLADASGVFKLPRNGELYPEFEFSANYITYTKEDLSESAVVEIDETNYTQFSMQPSISVSYYTGQLAKFTWNVIEDRPLMEEEELFYKYNNSIKDKRQPHSMIPSADYFYFNKASEFYKPNKSAYKIMNDYDTGILSYADFNSKFDGSYALQVDFRQGFKVIDLSFMSDNRVIVYYSNPFDETICAIVWNRNLIAEDTFTRLDDNSLSSVLYNYDYTAPTTETFTVRLYAFTWSGLSLPYRNYVIPEIFAILTLASFELLDNEFSMLDSKELINVSSFVEYKKEIEEAYKLDQELKGDHKDLLRIQESIVENFLDVYK